MRELYFIAANSKDVLKFTKSVIDLDLEIHEEKMAFRQWYFENRGRSWLGRGASTVHYGRVKRLKRKHRVLMYRISR